MIYTLGFVTLLVVVCIVMTVKSLGEIETVINENERRSNNQINDLVSRSAPIEQIMFYATRYGKRPKNGEVNHFIPCSSCGVVYAPSPNNEDFTSMKCPCCSTPLKSFLDGGANV